MKTKFLKILFDNLEAIAFYSSIVAAALGAFALVMVWWGWAWLGPRYREFWAKCAVAFFRAMAAISAVAAKVSTPKAGVSPWEQPWTSTVFIAIAGYLLWEVAGAVGDHKFKLSKEKTIADHKKEVDALLVTHQEALDAAAQELEDADQDREDAEFEAVRLRWLLTHLRLSVNEKRERVRRIAQSSAVTRASIQQARDGLSPEDQLHVLLQMLASLFHYEATHERGSRHDQNFRVGLFAERDGRMEPLDAFDLATRSHDPFSSFEQHADRYRMDNGVNPSHAVRCVREGRSIIVPGLRRRS